jgi:alpha-aminoadipic semialdehyde synthase
MHKVIGIRREDKNEWEQRTPLVPQDVKELKERHGIHTIVQPSAIRVFSDDEYRQAGAEVAEDLGPASVVLAVKEIPARLFERDKTYLFFAHVIKGQSHNMAMLRQMMDLGVNLLDYERFLDEANRRLIFFGRYAGLAGMVETLHAYGQKLALLGYQTPLEKIKQPHHYSSLEACQAEIAAIGEEIDDRGLPAELPPLAVGFAGYGNVSRGAQEIFDLLPHKVVSPQILAENYENFTADHLNLYKAVFKEEDLVKAKEGDFELQDYYDHPEKYVSQFEQFIPYLQILVNCIYWTEAYPRLVTREYLRTNTILKSNLNLKVIGDISCDIDGSIEITHKATMPDQPCFTYFAERDAYEDGVGRRGVTVMAVDNLPCEFAREASVEFSAVLKEYVNDIVSADFNRPTDQPALAGVAQRALVLHKGRLTGNYQYIQQFLNQEQRVYIQEE